MFCNTICPYSVLTKNFEIQAEPVIFITVIIKHFKIDCSYILKLESTIRETIDFLAFYCLFSIEYFKNCIKRITGEYLYSISIGGEVVHERVNARPRVFENIKIFTGARNFEAGDAYLDHLRIVSNETPDDGLTYLSSMY